MTADVNAEFSKLGREILFARRYRGKNRLIL
jgi:ribosomal protein L34